MSYRLSDFTRCVWLVLPVLTPMIAQSQDIAGFRKSRNVQQAFRATEAAVQSPDEAARSTEYCGELITGYGEPWHKMRAALHALIEVKGKPQPNRDADILRDVRFYRLPAHLARAVESFYLLAEAQTHQGVQQHRIDMAIDQLAAWTGVSRDALAFLAAEATKAEGSPNTTRVEESPIGPGRSLEPFDPRRAEQIYETYLLVRVPLLSALQAFVAAPSEDVIPITAGRDVDLGRHGQFQQLIVDAVEVPLRRVLTEHEQELVWTQWLGGQSPTQICQNLPKSAPEASAKTISEQRLNGQVVHVKPSPHARACLKSYAQCCGVTVERLTTLTPEEMQEQRDRIEVNLLTYEMRGAATDESARVLHAAIRQGMAPQQVRLFGDFLVVRAYRQERRWQELIQTVKMLRTTRGLRSTYLTPDKAETDTHFTEESLHNLLLLFEHDAGMQLDADTAVAATLEVLDDYRNLESSFQLLEWTDSHVFARLRNISVTSPHAINRVGRVDRRSSGITIILKGRNANHRLDFDNNGLVTVHE